ncbi:squalene/phytoene synthase family protein [Pseudonocardia sp. RS11V-5]|uniref:squalene/phytoene synthase family protein n=1 Tax=Pseudonocardia terrae TaxID=2905831 RepID=UPI001E4F06B2|nr:squalene/phytoene synthase family protein [Pseudonocardia terrae]MCE3553390.1 squalene/phytoene synthase family protein [Pseudonocardia terrae]
MTDPSRPTATTAATTDRSPRPTTGPGDGSADPEDGTATNRTEDAPGRPLDLAAAYAACEEITRREARNFSYGIRLLPAPKRAALSAVYALARRIDDIGDGDFDPPGGATVISFEEKSAALAEVRASIRAMRAQRPDPSDPVLVGVTDAARRYPIPLGAFEELVDGVEADARMDRDASRSGADGARGVDHQDLAARPHTTFDDMTVYCRQVAGSVGRLCLGTFGSRPHPRAAEYADALGIALQQTNILRDIREDLRNGRVYLPTGELARFGAELRLDDAGALADPDGALAAYIRFAAERARGWYVEGLKLLPLLDRRSAACAGAMAGIYRRLLEDIAAEPRSVYAQRRSLSGAQKIGVALRALAGRTA